jgi:small GTP-binding protein
MSLSSIEDDLDFEYLFKIVLVGDSAVGKSNLESRFTRNVFTQGSKATIGVDFAGKTVIVQDRKVRAQIWDTAGQERFKAVSNTYYRNAAAALVVYDITNKKSFASVDSWVRNIREFGNSDVVVMIVGNKSDLEQQRQVSTEEGHEMAEREGFLFMETSAFSGDNVENAFLSLLSNVMDTKREKGELVGVDKGQEDLSSSNSHGNDHQPPSKLGGIKGLTNPAPKGYSDVGSHDVPAQGIKLEMGNQNKNTKEKSCCSS